MLQYLLTHFATWRVAGKSPRERSLSETETYSIDWLRSCLVFELDAQHLTHTIQLHHVVTPRLNRVPQVECQLLRICD